MAAPKGKGSESADKSFCGVAGCKSDVKRFGFCQTHFEHFKFGLITKKGEKVLDYDKKYDHFMDHKEREQKPKKVA